MEVKINLALKRRLFIATVQSVVIYGSESWTLNVQQQKSLDGTYMRMLRKALNISLKEHFTNTNMYDKLPLVSSTIKYRRMKMAGHCIRHPELSAQPLTVWEPTQGKANIGRRHCNYLDMKHTDARVENQQDHPQN